MFNRHFNLSSDWMSWLCFAEDNTVEKLTLSETSKTYDINERIPITLKSEPDDADLDDIECRSSGGKFSNNGGGLSFTAAKDGVYKLSVVCGDVESNTIKITIEDKKAIAEAKKKAEEEAKKKAEEEKLKAEEEAKKKAEEEAKSKAEAETQEPQEEMVWIPKSGSKYHSRSSCSGMEDPREVTISEAKHGIHAM